MIAGNILESVCPLAGTFYYHHYHSIHTECPKGTVGKTGESAVRAPEQSRDNDSGVCHLLGDAVSRRGEQGTLGQGLKARMGSPPESNFSLTPRGSLKHELVHGDGPTCRQGGQLFVPKG